MKEGPAISVVIGTYERLEMLQRAVKSILANEGPLFELIIVDQSIKRLPADYFSDARVRILRGETRGLSAARNLGTSAALGELIAYTDDDCEVGPRWLGEIQKAFERHPKVGLILGSVLAGDRDSTAGFVPACVHTEVRIYQQLDELPGLEVMGACMAIRKAVWQRLGGFWDEIGAGRRIRAGEDYDFALRALDAGIPSMESPEVVVVHHGFRTWKEGRTLFEGYTFSTAYVLAYRLILRPVDLIRCLGGFWRRFMAKTSKVIASGGRQQGGRILVFAHGLLRGAGARLWSEIDSKLRERH